MKKLFPPPLLVLISEIARILKSSLSFVRFFGVSLLPPLERYSFLFLFYNLDDDENDTEVLSTRRIGWVWGVGRDHVAAHKRLWKSVPWLLSFLSLFMFIFSLSIHSINPSSRLNVILIVNKVLQPHHHPPNLKIINFISPLAAVGCAVAPRGCELEKTRRMWWVRLKTAENWVLRVDDGEELRDGSTSTSTSSSSVISEMKSFVEIRRSFPSHGKCVREEKCLKRENALWFSQFLSSSSFELHRITELARTKQKISTIDEGRKGVWSILWKSVLKICLENEIIR